MATTPVSFATCTSASAIGERVGDRDLDQHMLAGAHHWLALRGVHLRRAGEDRRLDAGLLQALGEIGRSNAGSHFFATSSVPGAGRGRRIERQPTSNAAGMHFLDRLEMLDAERALAGETDFMVMPLACRALATSFSRMMCRPPCSTPARVEAIDLLRPCRPARRA